ncbi:hypothetical protein ACFSTD_08950 [Novosphingobium colocasiae]
MAQHHVAAGGDHIAGLIVFHGIGGESHRGLAIGGDGRRGRCPGDRLVLHRAGGEVLGSGGGPSARRPARLPATGRAGHRTLATGQGGRASGRRRLAAGTARQGACLAYRTAVA